MAEGQENLQSDSGNTLPAEAPAEVVVPVVVDETPQATAEASQGTTVVVLKRSYGSPSCAAVLIVAILAAAALAYVIFYRAPKELATGAKDLASSALTAAENSAGKLADGLRGAFKTEVNYRTAFVGSIESARESGKLVVYTQSVTAVVEKTSEKKYAIKFIGDIKLGDTVTSLRAQGNKVQYYIPLDTLDESDFSYDADAKCLTVFLPRPVLDTEMVEVQSNPELIEIRTDVGWGRLGSYSGAFLEEQAKKELRDAVLKEGSKPMLREKADTEGESLVRTKLFAPLVQTLADGVTMKVVYREGETP
ncbi:MAG: DUF4230 domain-containing protein [Candidatus Hydrogenedentes bacterium]|nr:DUF4230 domain-containing protein [Candidatus Hydrogenedentota bacterium]